MAFTILTRSVQKLIDKIIGGTNGEQKESPSTSKIQSTQNDLENLKEDAKKVQENFKPFGTEDLFRILVDPFSQTQQELFL